MSDKTNADKHIAHALENTKKSSLEKIKTPMAHPDTNHSAAPTNQEENLIIPKGTTLITDRSFINLDWSKQDHQGLIFKNCTIINSNFAASNLDGLRLENCNVFNTSFEKASIQDGLFEDCSFYEKQN